MSKPLIIAEKPDMGRKIAAALDGPSSNKAGYIETKDYIVSWCVGHILRSLKPNEYNTAWEKWSLDNLPMFVTNWEVSVDEKKASQFKVLKELLKSAPSVIHAGDPGREGQLIVDEVLHFVKYKKPVQRILLYSLDKVSIRQAMQNLKPNEDFHPLYQAAIGRGIADWYLGMNGSVAYTLQAQKNGYKGVLSVGRVQSPTVAIVVDRDNKIKNFVSHAYYTISADFTFLGKTFKTNWKPNASTQIDWLDEDKRLINKEVADSIAKKIVGKDGRVKHFEEKPGKSSPPLPFNLNNIQIYANNKWGMSAEETLQACQNLYEKHELQTYPRTDCTYLPEIQHGDASHILKNLNSHFPDLAQAAGNANPQLKSPAWNDKKLGEHFGLIPTKKEPVLSELSANELKIYRAVCERYIVQFYPDCEFTSSQVIIDCEGEDFKASGKIIQVPGWQGIFDAEPEEAPEEGQEPAEDDESTVFPPIKSGDIGKCVGQQLQAKKTTPPAYFTEATLLKAMTQVHTLVDDPAMKKKLMECKGIGQVATRTGILKTVYDRGLLEKKGRKILSTPASQALVAALPKKVTNPVLTAVWEDALDKVAEGKVTLDTFKAQQERWITQLIDEAKNTNVVVAQAPASASSSGGKSTGSTGAKPAAKAAGKKKGKTCPQCKKGELVKRVAKASGKEFLACSNYQECKYVEWPKK